MLFLEPFILKKEEVRSSETSLTIYQSTRPELYLQHFFLFVSMQFSYKFTYTDRPNFTLLKDLFTLHGQFDNI